MSEGAKRYDQRPESYSPKDRPEIISMTQENAGRVSMNKTFEVKTANGGSYIDGVPALKWGEWKDCTYSGAVALTLNVLGIDATYEQIAGLTGSCYRLSMCYGWDPGSAIVDVNYHQLGFAIDRNASRAFGVDLYTIEDEDERNEKVRKSIDAGAPVLTLGSRANPEWNILTGYERAGEEIRYFGRSYFDGDAKENEFITGNRYVLADHYPGEYPGGFVRFCDRKSTPTPPRDALRQSLEACLKMFAPRERMGYGAYEFMIQSLKDDNYLSLFSKKACSGWDMRMHFRALLDARRAAYIFLEEGARLLSLENRLRLMNASAMYRDMFELLMGVLPYDELAGNVFDAGLSSALRQGLIHALQGMAALEKKVRVVVSEILDGWEA